MNDFEDKTNKYLNELLSPSDNLKKEIEKIIKQFEETIKNLCIPLILEREGLNTIDISKLNQNRKDEFNEEKLSVILKINDFENDSKKLNNQYNILFNQINKAIQIICQNIKKIPSILNDLQDKL